MYSSIETPPIPSASHQTQYQYHANAFNIHSTAITKTSTAGAGAPLAPIPNGSVKSIMRPSADAHTKQSSTIFNNNSNNSRNKFSYGAYNSTCRDNNFEHVKDNIRTTKFNEKM